MLLAEYDCVEGVGSFHPTGGAKSTSRSVSLILITEFPGRASRTSKERHPSPMEESEAMVNTSPGHRVL